MNDDKEVQRAIEVLCDALEEHNIDPAIGLLALIRLAAMSAGREGVDCRAEASTLFAAVWILAYSETH